ncbi:MAG: leucine-rich repeat protein, partial [Clostridia bacterium]|nr:leucine-rich repeat protein [Clostridia bacterium]
MKTGLKRTISVIACLVMLLSIIGVGALSVSANSTTHGTCGDNLTWTFENGTLTISGEGKMIDFYYTDDQPWFQWITEPIYDVVIEDGVTSIGDNAFISCSINSISISDSVTSIGYQAFYECTKLASITIPDSVTSIGWQAFGSCT